MQSGVKAAAPHGSKITIEIIDFLEMKLFHFWQNVKFFGPFKTTEG